MGKITGEDNKHNFLGTIIEESLFDTSILKGLNILSTRVEKVIEKHKTPWLKQWTLHKVSIPAVQAKDIAELISQSLDPNHNWYADYKSEKEHYIIFRKKVFKIDRSSEEQYNQAKEYGIGLGIPDYQMDFSPNVEK